MSAATTRCATCGVKLADTSIRRLVDAIDRPGIAPPPKGGRAKGMAGLGAVTGLLLQQPMGFTVTALGVVRAKSDLPPRGDARAFHTFAALLVVLAVVARVAGRTV